MIGLLFEHLHMIVFRCDLIALARLHAHGKGKSVHLRACIASRHATQCELVKFLGSWIAGFEARNGSFESGWCGLARSRITAIVAVQSGCCESTWSHIADNFKIRDRLTVEFI